jgi:predicted molibdopterin-dependent oxidoreductase YjgC
VASQNGKVKSIQAPYAAEANQGHTCLKGRFAFSFYNHPERLNTPLIRKNGKLEPASWMKRTITLQLNCAASRIITEQITLQEFPQHAVRMKKLF